MIVLHLLYHFGAFSFRLSSFFSPLARDTLPFYTTVDKLPPVVFHFLYLTHLSCSIIALYEEVGLDNCATALSKNNENQKSHSSVYSRVYSVHSVDCRNHPVRRIPAWNFRPAT